MSTSSQFYLRLSIVLAAAVGIAPGCSKSDPVSVPPLVQPPSLAGSWELQGSGGLVLTMNNTQRGTIVEGAISLSSGGTPVRGSVHGKCMYPQVTLTFTSPGYYDLKFAGTLHGTSSLSGLLNESGFTNYPVSGTRK